MLYTEVQEQVKSIFLTVPIILLESLSSAIRPEKEMKAIHIKKEETTFITKWKDYVEKRLWDHKRTIK